MGTALLASEYVHFQTLTPGQVRYSSRNVQLKIDAAFIQGDLFCNSEGTLSFKHHNGTSIFPEEEALPVIIAPFGYVLADGHHHTLAAVTLNAPYLPIKPIADLSNLTPEQFWQVAENNGWVFLYDPEGNRKIPSAAFSNQSFKDLADDPNRYFAAITARKCKERKDFSESTGAEYPLWIKVGKDIPFIEFRISDALRKAGIEYSYEMGDEPSIDFVECARKILVESKIPGLRVVPQRTHYSELPPPC